MRLKIGLFQGKDIGERLFLFGSVKNAGKEKQ